MLYKIATLFPDPVDGYGFASDPQACEVVVVRALRDGEYRRALWSEKRRRIICQPVFVY